MEILIWVGAVISVIGVLGLAYCIIAAAKARNEGLSEDAMKTRLHSLVAMNMGAVAISSIGLMMVVVGILLG